MAGEIIGAPELIARAFQGEDLNPLAEALRRRVAADAADAAALLDLGTLYVLHGLRDQGLACQAEALRLQPLYRQRSALARPGGLRLLALALPGDLMANIPLQFLLEGSDLTLDLLYLVPDRPLPESPPEHDLMILLAGESESARPLLQRLCQRPPAWRQRPLLNPPERVLALGRHAVCQNLQGIPGLVVPQTVQIEAAALARLAAGALELDQVLPQGHWPILVRPLDSHAGHGLARVEQPAELASYLAEQPARTYYLSQFIDYSCPDGQFRKYRVALVDGQPLVSHLAVSSRWMVHYLNADMHESAAKRAEEGQAFAAFDQGFARRHAAALAGLHQRLGLDYCVIDCGETQEGQLLLFEADTAMIVHAMDSIELYPYKRPQMLRIFQAFQALLQRRAGRIG